MTAPLAVISGVVLDSAGNPLADARVYFVEGPGPLPDIAALTDAQGRFQLSAPGSGLYVVAVAADGPAGVVRQTIPVTVDGRRVRRTLDVRLTESGAGTSAPSELRTPPVS